MAFLIEKHSSWDEQQAGEHEGEGRRCCSNWVEVSTEESLGGKERREKTETKDLAVVVWGCRRRNKRQQEENVLKFEIF